MSTIICCGCEHEGPDRSKCGFWDGHPGACTCDCHAATHTTVLLNRAEVEEALASLSLPLDGLTELRITDQLCRRWGIDR